MCCICNIAFATQSHPILRPGEGATALVVSSEQEVAERDEIRMRLANATAYFIKNSGQVDKEVKYYFMGKDVVYFTDRAVVFQKTQRNPHQQKEDAGGDFSHHHSIDVDIQKERLRTLAYKLEFVGANPTPPQARNKLKGKVAYFKGKDRSLWHNDIPTYQEIVYFGLYRGNSHAKQDLTSRGSETARAISGQDCFAENKMQETSGIDLVYKGVPGGMKYEFVIGPGADPDIIKLAYTGVEGLSIDEVGNLIIHTALGDVKDSKPYCYQDIEGKRIEIESGFKILNTQTKSCSVVQDDSKAGETLLCTSNDMPVEGVVDLRTQQTTGTHNEQSGTGDQNSEIPNLKHLYGFVLSPYNNNYPLIIDPGLEYSTFLGGRLTSEEGYGIALDGSGNIYITGSIRDNTGTGPTTFPTTTGAYDDTYNGGSYDVFVTKLTPSGAGANDLLYSTFLGGGGSVGDDIGYDIAVDVSGNIYVTGRTGKNSGFGTTNFPTTTGAYNETHNGDVDVFVTKLAPSGTGTNDLLYSTFLGGSGGDFGYGIAVDVSGNIYVTGRAGDGFPTTTGAFDETYNGGTYDVFVAKLTPSGTGANDLLYSTFLGGSGSDQGNGIALDGSGNLYVAGDTADSTTDFPTTTGAYDETHNGGTYDVFVTKLTSSGAGANDLIYSTFLGGSGSDQGHDMVVDSSGNIFVAGDTADSTTAFPTTTGAYDESHNGGTGAFALKLIPSGTGVNDLLYSTFLGESGNDGARGIAVDVSGNIYVTGRTGDGFPATTGGYDTTYNGSFDAFVSKLTPSGTGANDLLYSTFLGGSGEDSGMDIAVDGSGDIYVTGRTTDSTTDFPATTGAYLTTHNGGNGNITTDYDAFVARLTTPCVYSLLPADKIFSSSAGSDNVNVLSESGCAWTASSSVGWITIGSGSSGIGDGAVSYSIASNSSKISRTGTIIIGGNTITITQNGDDDNEIIMDFGAGTGIWVRWDNGTWELLHNYSPESITTDDVNGNGKDEIIFNFGPGIGIWVRWDNDTWTQLHKLSPESITTGDIDGNDSAEIIMDFGAGIGIWIRWDDGTWTQLHSRSPESITSDDVDGNGKDEIIIDFGAGTGIWIRWDSGTWMQLHKLSPESITTGDTDGNGSAEIIMDFGTGTGIWVMWDDGTWTQLHNYSPESITTDDIDGNDKDEIIMDFGAGTGIWIRWDGGAWTQLHNLSPESITTGDLNRNGKDEIIMDFGPGTAIWVRWDDGAWTQLHNLSPESITTGDLGG